jgi:hypothetical protein
MKILTHFRTFQRPGAFFLIVLIGIYWRVSTAPKGFWQYRDDSVIHLSHAKNFALHGSIGISPGDRTEAMSSPLNFLISQFWFLVSPNLSYETYLDIYNVFVLIFFALSYTYCVTQILKKIEKLNQTQYWLVSITPLILVLGSWTTFGWMISGMENSLGASLILLLLGLYFRAKKTRGYLISLIITLLGLARIEFAILLLPFFSGILFHLRGSSAPLKRLVVDLSPIFLIWGFFHGARYLYFGQLSPNTAQALGISASLAMVVFLLTQLYLLSHIMGLTKSINSQFNFAILIVHSCSILLIVRSNLSKGNFQLAPSVVIIILLVSIAVLAYSKYQINSTMQIAILLLAGQLNEYFLFGPARLSAFRIVAIFVPGLLTLSLKLLLDSLPADKFDRKELALLIILPVLPIAFLVLSQADPVRNLCCRISPSEDLIIKEAKGFLDTNNLTQTARPISASPDLGKLSFAKKTIIIDLGLIGDPLLGYLSISKPAKVASFLNDYAMPDIVESHGFWSCAYSDFLESAEFKERYRVKYSGSVSTEFNFPPQTSCPFSGNYTIWVRVLPEAESLFAFRLNSGLIEDFPRLIMDEVAKCAEDSSEITRCQYVYRSILREIERVNKSKISSKIFDSLKLSPTYKLDVYRLEKRSGWQNKAGREVLNLLS